MPKGIVNPFFEKPVVPKTDPSKIPVQQRGSRDPEQPLPKLPKKKYFDLDGESYIVRIWDVKDLEEVVKRLGQLIYDVKKKHEDTLFFHGIYFTPEKQTWTIRTPSGDFFVYIPEGGGALDVYRRLGYALSRLRTSIKDTLESLGIQVIERG